MAVSAKSHRIYRCSPLLAVCWPGKRRHATFHLDHFFSDWSYVVNRRGAYKFWDLVRLVGTDVHTEWQPRYYVYTGETERD